MIAGLVISLCAFGGALAMLYRLALLEVGESRAWEVVLLLAVFPTPCSSPRCTPNRCFSF